MVAIVGRPNVGKSTLFNRIIKQRKAIVDDRPGVTRDRVYGDGSWNGREFILVDTGGFVPRSQEIITSLVTQQVELAMDQADVVMFILDTKVGLQTTDEDIASLLKRSHKKALLVANKADSEKDLADTAEFYKLGLGEVYPVSSTAGRLVGDLLDALVEKLPPVAPVEGDVESIDVAIVGRPNVGKSSLFNAVIGEQKQIVAATPGTTRDSVDSLVEIRGQRFKFIDTAGLRKKTRYPDIIEYYSSLRSLRAIERSSIALVVIDSSDGITGGDIRIAGEAAEMRRGLVFIANKWDLVKGVEQYHFSQEIYAKAPLLNYAKIVFTCALTGKGVGAIIDAIIETNLARKFRIGTPDLNDFLERAVSEKHPPARRGRLIKFYYATQAESEPPTFIIFSNYPDSVDKSYRRFLENKLRRDYAFPGTPLNLIFKKRS